MTPVMSGPHFSGRGSKIGSGELEGYRPAGVLQRIGQEHSLVNQTGSLLIRRWDREISC